MGVLPHPLGGGGDPHAVQQLDRPPAGLPPGQAPVHPEQFPDLEAHRPHRVEGRQRVLEHHGQAAPPHPAAVLAGRGQQVDTAEEHGSRHHPPGPLDQPHHRLRRDALPRPRLPQDGQRLAGGQVEVDAVDGRDHPVPGGELDGEVPHRQDRAGVSGGEGRRHHGGRRRGGRRPGRSG
jgi:hypothetical protein